MTIDERAAACVTAISGTTQGTWHRQLSSIIARHLREAVAERDAELRAEIERLRERVRFHARSKLKYYLSTEDVLIHLNSEKAWFMAQTSQAAFLLELAEEAGVWFDDDGNEVPLAGWRAQQGEKLK